MDSFIRILSLTYRKRFKEVFFKNNRFFRVKRMDIDGKINLSVLLQIRAKGSESRVKLGVKENSVWPGLKNRGLNFL
jgi:hypothetical protein